MLSESREKPGFFMVNEIERDSRPLIAIVGPCASGKSLLVRALRERGYNAREVAQEHSYVPAMWQIITQPDTLIYLHVSWEAARQRRPTDAGPSRWEEQAHRLRHARQHADFYVDTDGLTPREALER
ncbi:MAG: hypothetical protein U9R15_07320, partial [Chloroflexota bacterium]|nr:hypothetical protein [Chloroflexota bacterium]